MRVVIIVGATSITVDAPVGARSGIDSNGDAGADLIDALAVAARRLPGVKQLRQLPSRLVVWTEDAAELERLAEGLRTWLERRGCGVGVERRA